MKKEDFKQHVYLLVIGAIFSLIGAVVGGIIVIKSSEDRSPLLVASLVDANQTDNKLFIEILNVEDYPAVGIYGVYGIKHEIPLFDREISLSDTSAIKDKPVIGVIDLSYIKSNLTAEEIVGAGSSHFTYKIPFEINCQNCKKEDIIYLNEYALVSFDAICNYNQTNCKYEMSLVSFA